MENFTNMDFIKSSFIKKDRSTRVCHCCFVLIKYRSLSQEKRKTGRRLFYHMFTECIARPTHLVFKSLPIDCLTESFVEKQTEEQMFP